MLRYISSLFKTVVKKPPPPPIRLGEVSDESLSLLESVFNPPPCPYKGRFTSEESGMIRTAVKSAIVSMEYERLVAPERASLEVQHLFKCYEGTHGDDEAQLAFGYLYNTHPEFREVCDRLEECL